VAGAPFFFGDGDSEGVGFGVSPFSGVALGVAEGPVDSDGDGLGVGELFRFFFLLDALGDDSGVGLGDDFFFFAEIDALGEDSGVGLGEDFFFFDEEDALEEGVSDGVGVAAVFFFGDGDFSGVALGLGVGDFSAVDFFFVCLRGAGVGVGANTFLSLSPNDSSAGVRTAKAVTIAQIITVIRSARILEPERSTTTPTENRLISVVIPSREDGEGPRSFNFPYRVTTSASVVVRHAFGESQHCN
jgi:hypothetical protein